MISSTLSHHEMESIYSAGAFFFTLAAKEINASSWTANQL